MGEDQKAAQNDEDDMKRLDPNAESDLRLTEEGMTIVEPPRRMTTGGGRGRLSLLIMGAGLILIGLSLRIGGASVGPVPGDTRRDTRLRAAVGTLLTTIPVFAFGAFSFLTPRADTQVRHASGARDPHDRPRRRHRPATAAEPARALRRHRARGRGHRRRQC